MAGKLFKAVPKTTFDFTAGLSTGGTTSLFLLGDPIDITPYTQVGVNVRVHSSNINGVNGTAYLQVGILSDGFFDYASFAYNGAIITYTGVGPSGGPAALFASGFATGTYATVYVMGHIDLPGWTLNASISVDVWGRSPDEIDPEGQAALINLRTGISRADSSAPVLVR